MNVLECHSRTQSGLSDTDPEIPGPGSASSYYGYPAEMVAVRPRIDCLLTAPIWSGARIGLYNLGTGPRRRLLVFSGSFQPGGMPRMWTQKNRFAFPPSRWSALINLNYRAGTRAVQLHCRARTRHPGETVTQNSAAVPGERRAAQGSPESRSCPSARSPHAPGAPSAPFLGRLEVTLPQSQGFWAVNDPQGD